MPETVQQLVRALAESDGTGLAFEDSTWTWARDCRRCRSAGTRAA